MPGNRILIVEDNLVNLELAKDILEMAGYEILEASTAEEGIKLTRAELPDLILMDVGLPGMDGLQAIRILKQDPAVKHIPMVCLTAHAMAGDEEKAREAGSDGYITKPINTRELPKQAAQFINRD